MIRCVVHDNCNFIIKCHKFLTQFVKKLFKLFEVHVIFVVGGISVCRKYNIKDDLCIEKNEYKPSKTYRQVYLFLQTYKELVQRGDFGVN